MALKLENINNFIADDLDKRNENWTEIDTTFALKADTTYVDNQDSALTAQLVKITSKSENLLPITRTELTFNGVTSVYEDGVIVVTGTPTGTGGRTQKRIGVFNLPAGTYTLSWNLVNTIDAIFLQDSATNAIIDYINDVKPVVTFTLANNTNVFLGFNILSLTPFNASATMMLVEGMVKKDFEPPSYITSHDAVARDAIDKIVTLGNLTNQLKGLKLVVAGDSITAGESTEYEYGIIAKDYYGLNYLNTAMSGKTIADVKVNGVSRNGFAVERYLLVPDDTDILTIWFGYNDQAYGWSSKRDDYCIATYGVLYQSLTAEQKTAVDAYKTQAQWVTDFIGVVTDTDTKTWCGAWNFVLDYFVIQKSIERIGVILPYGVDNAYIEPLKFLCNRYAVPYIDSANPNQIASVGHSNYPFSKSGHYRALYTYDGLHPNEEGYDRIARGYIDWLVKI